MNFRTFSIELIVFFICYSWIGHAQVNLDSCQAMARKNYPMIRQYELLEQTEEFSVSNAGKAYLPQLSIQFIGGIIDGLPSFDVPRNNSGSNSDLQLISVAQIKQAVWDGGVTKAAKKVASANVAIEKSALDLELYQLRNRIDQLYFGILLMEEQIRQQQLFHETLERNAKRTEVAIENGTAYRSDLDELKVELLNAEERLLEMNYSRSAYIRVLSLMIGETLDENESFSRPEIEFVDVDKAISRPELVKFESQRALLDAKTDMNRSALYPRIGVLGFGTFLSPGINFGTEEVNRVLLAGLSVSWDIGGLYRHGNNKKLEEISVSKLHNREETFLFNTRLLLGEAEMELQKYQDLLDKDRELLDIKKRIKKAFEVKYENGVCTMTELLDKTNDEQLAQQQLILHEILYLQKIYDYKFKSGN